MTSGPSLFVTKLPARAPARALISSRKKSYVFWALAEVNKSNKIKKGSSADFFINSQKFPRYLIIITNKGKGKVSIKNPVENY